MKNAMVILAAGYSSRMGAFKPLLPVGTEPAIIRCVNMAKAAGISSIVVVTGYLHEELENTLREKAEDVTVVYNERFEEGMFSSVLAGIKALPTEIDGFYVLPADVCTVKPETLSLVEAKIPENIEYTVLAPAFRGREGHPPLIPSQQIPKILARKSSESLSTAIMRCIRIPVEVGDRGVLLDMDTPKDYAELLRNAGLRAYPDKAACAALFEKYKVPEEIRRHGRQTAAMAKEIARRMIERGAVLDVELLESACLVHDILRAEPNHAEAGMNLLLREGYPDAAGLVGEHMDPTRIAPMDVRESELLFLADKLCYGLSYMTIQDTIDLLAVRFRGDPEAQTAARVRLRYAKIITLMLYANYGIDDKELVRAVRPTL